jgi:hypothetical protein
MVFSNFEKTVQVICDVTGVAIGEVLSRDNRHVSYFSEKPNETKRNYSTYARIFMP